MNTIDVKELKREIKDLGILNIEAYGSLTLDDIDKNNQKLRKIKG